MSSRAGANDSEVIARDALTIASELPEQCKGSEIVRINRPALLKLANVHADYAGLLAAVSETVDNARGVVEAVVRAIDDPLARSMARREVADDLFYLPGSTRTGTSGPTPRNGSNP